ncbi:hypothetical protein [Acidithiobacillus thiooxidans]|jgi:hypothetical protein|nr:hypothetical protein [Acidithiobacillus thiooxidans]
MVEKIFYRKTGEYTLLAWKRMLPGLSDTMMLLIIGIQALKVASAVLIPVLAINIALGSFSTLLMMHRRELSDRVEICAAMLQGAFAAAGVIIVIGVTSRIVFGAEVGAQSLTFLLLCVARPFFVIWNIYHREILYRDNRHRVFQSLTTRAVGLYIVITWASLSLATMLDWYPSILLLLSGVYISQAFTALYIYRHTFLADRLSWREIGTILRRAMTIWPGRVLGLRVALYNSVTNVLEFGFLAIAGWIIEVRVESIAIIYYPLFNMFELASAFALGISRVCTERRIVKEPMPPQLLLTVIFGLYAIVFVPLYIGLATLMSDVFGVVSPVLISFAVAYVFFDGIQLILRSKMLAQESGGRLLHISFIAYLIGLAGLLATWAVPAPGNVALLYLALILPLVVATGFLSNEKGRRSRLYGTS